MSVEITNVVKGSPASRAGIHAGDLLVKLNGEKITDVLDYMYYSSEASVKIELIRKDKTLMFKVAKSEYDDLGMEFHSFLMDDKQSCCNKCVFCFIDQTPPNMRETLYFKDDDARLSFLQGNYVTLTNLSQDDIDRIVRMHLNINVSVHTTNPELRCVMMHNRFAGDKLKYLKQLSDGNIKMNCQIVLCPGLNDGKELERTLSDLDKLMPNILSIAVVPVGITKYREGLFHLDRFNKETAGQALDIIERFGEKFLKEQGTRLVFPADEFYLLAERDMPDGDFYEDYSQYENGVGMVRSLYDELESAVENCDDTETESNVSLVTGTAAAEFIQNLVEKVQNKFKNVKCTVYPIINDFFGDTITVSGLLTGQDIIKQLKGKTLGEYLLIPSTTIKKNSDLFLDDYVISDVERELNIKVKLVDNDGIDFLYKILGLD